MTGYKDGILLWQRPPGAGPEREALEELGPDNPIPVRVESVGPNEGVHHRTAQVSVGTSATLILPANPKRRSVVITQITGTQIAYIGTGPTPAITTGTGAYLGATAGNSLTMTSQDAIYGIAATGAQTVSYLEEYTS